MYSVIDETLNSQMKRKEQNYNDNDDDDDNKRIIKAMITKSILPLRLFLLIEILRKLVNDHVVGLRGQFAKCDSV
jgi:hypothetical protein